MRAQVALFVITGLAALNTACSDDPKPGGDTIDDTSDVVDTSETDGSGDTETSGDTSGDGSDATETTPTDTETVDTTPDGEVIQTLAVVVNEIAATGDPADWIEFHNAGTDAVDITGWLLRDSDPTHAYVFGAGSSLAAGAYLVLERDDTGVAGFNFGLGGADAVFLYDPDQNLVSTTSWNEGESPAGRSWGRIPNASGDFKTLISPTRGAANQDNPLSTCGDDTIEGLELCDGTAFGDTTCKTFGWGAGSLSCIESCTRISQTACTARAPGLVLNEVESDESDRIEIFNGTANPLDLAGFQITDAGGGSYTLPASSIIAAGGYLVLERDINHTFGLGDDDAVNLLDSDVEVVDSISWLPGRAIPSYGRTPNGVGGFRTSNDQTFGNENL